MIPALLGLLAARRRGSGGASGFRYYRLNITAAASSPNGSTGIAEFELLHQGVDQIPTMTDYTTDGVTCSASAESSADTVWRTGDGVVDINEWFTGAGGGERGWLQYQFPSAIEIDAYAIQAHTSGNSAYTPTTFQLWGSNTGAFSGEHAVLDTRTGEPSWGNGEKRTYGPPMLP